MWGSTTGAGSWLAFICSCFIFALDRNIPTGQRKIKRLVVVNKRVRDQDGHNTYERPAYLPTVAG